MVKIFADLVERRQAVRSLHSSDLKASVLESFYFLYLVGKLNIEVILNSVICRIIGEN